MDLKTLAKVLTYHCFRESLEDIHSEDRITQEEIKQINKSVCNHLYTLLYHLDNGGKLMDCVYINPVNNWDDPVLIKRLLKALEA